VTDPIEAGRRVNEGFLAIIDKVPGFVAYYWVDAGGGVMISTSIFENQSGRKNQTKGLRIMCARKWPRCFQSRPRLRLGKLSLTRRNRMSGRDHSEGTSDPAHEERHNASEAGDAEQSYFYGACKPVVHGSPKAAISLRSEGRPPGPSN
jgi:hypothetical protein